MLYSTDGPPAKYPILTVTGPRQSGKTTLCRSLFPGFPWVNLEPIDTREVVRHAQADSSSPAHSTSG